MAEEQEGGEATQTSEEQVAEALLPISPGNKRKRLPEEEEEPEEPVSESVEKEEEEVEEEAVAGALVFSPKTSKASVRATQSSMSLPRREA